MSTSSNNLPQQKNEASNSTFTMLLPMLTLLIPICLSIFAGYPELWPDLLLATFLFYYLYLIVQLPWVLYLKTRVPETAFNSESSSSLWEPLSAELEALRFIAYKKLVWQQRLTFLVTLVAPILGGLFLKWVSKFNELISPMLTTNRIVLFVMTAELRPLTHLFHSLTIGTEKVIAQAVYTNLTSERLEYRLIQLENRLGTLDKAFTTKSELQIKLEGLQIEIKRLGQLVIRNYNKDKLEASRYDRLLKTLQVQLDDLYNELFLDEKEDKNHRTGFSIIKIISLPITLSLKLIKRFSTRLMFRLNEKPILHLLPHQNEED